MTNEGLVQRAVGEGSAQGHQSALGHQLSALGGQEKLKASLTLPLREYHSDDMSSVQGISQLRQFALQGGFEHRLCQVLCVDCSFRRQAEARPPSVVLRPSRSVPS